MSRQKKALITGGAGFIGSHLADRLLENGYEVLVVDNLTTGSLRNVPEAAEFEEVDIAGEELDGVFEHWRPDIVFHLAAQANVRLSLDDPLYDTTVNAHGTLNVLEGCRKHGARKIIFSSTGGAIYGEPETIPCDEDHPRLPLSLYGANKLVGEHYIDVYRTVYKLPFSIVRFANIYGPRQNPHGEAGVVAIFSQLMLAGKTPIIFGDGSKTRDYVYVADAVDALYRCIDGADGRIFNVGTGVRTSDQEVFDAVAAAVGFEGKPEYGEVRAGEVIHIALDAGRIREALDWQPTHGFREGVEKTVPFYRKQRP